MGQHPSLIHPIQLIFLPTFSQMPAKSTHPVTFKDMAIHRGRFTRKSRRSQNINVGEDYFTLKKIRVYVCMHMHAGTGAHMLIHAEATVCTWNPENNFIVSSLLPPSMCPKDPAHTVRTAKPVSNEPS